MRFVDRIDRLLFLHTVPLFGDLPQERLATLAEHMTELFLPANTVFQHEGDTIDHLRIVVEGNVQGFLVSGESWNFPPNSVLGVFEFFAEGSRQSIRTVSDTIILQIPTAILRNILEDYFDVAVHILRGLTRILLHFIGTHASDERLRDLASPVNPPPIPSNPDPVEQILILRKVVLFARASVDGLAALCRTTKIERFPAGTFLWKTGEVSEWGGIVLSGSIHAVRTMIPEGAHGGPVETTEFPLGPLSPPGLLEMLAERPRWFDARAAEDVVLLRIDLDDLYDTLEDHFDMTLECLGSFATAAIEVFERIGRARLAQIRADKSLDGDGLPLSLRGPRSAHLFEATPESMRTIR